MARSIPTVVREICLSFPETKEAGSHGMPDFKVLDKSFAYLCVNHHGDGRVALWLRSPAGAQEMYTELNPSAYFVPPYVGPRGWLGVELDKGLDWQDIANRAHEAYVHSAPAKLLALAGIPPRVRPPDGPLDPVEFNPLLGKRPREVMEQLAVRCGRLPEAVPGEQFGSPVWKAGKRTFVCVHHHADRLYLQFWVGVEQQAMLTSDKRYSISRYIGQNGWIDLDVHEWINWPEVESLLHTSYRHFALKRMLKALDESGH